MCGIIGYHTKKRGENDAFTLFKLMRQSRIRGLHSFGFSWYKNGKIETQKYFQNEFLSIKIPDSNTLIFHNRYSTSGDFKDHKNNQPIHIEDMSLAFNGVIDMGTKSEMEAHYGVKMATENDGELVLRMSGGDPADMVNFVQNKGSFSGILLQGGDLYAFTNGRRPLYQLTIGKSTFIASTRDIFVRALGDCDPQPIPTNTLMKWT